MTHEEQRKWMIRQLEDEDRRYRNYGIPKDGQEQKDLLRALMNVREPLPIGDAFLRIQDEYLTEETRRAGITDIADLQPTGMDERIYLWQGDITKLKVGAIVNAANSGMTGCYRPCHNCIDNCIHTYAGIQLRNYCAQMMQRLAEEKGGYYEEPTGQAKITPAYNLPCDYVIHTVGPIVSQGRLTKQHEKLLASCYRSCLELAEENHVESIAFCCISTGVFGFPQQRAAEIAVETVRNYYEETGSRMKVVFNVFKNEDLGLYEELLR